MFIRDFGLFLISFFGHFQLFCLFILSFFNSLKNISTYIVFAAAYGIAFCCVFIASFAQPTLLTLLDDFFSNLFNQWFTFPNGETPHFSEIPDLIGQEFAIFSENLYLIAFQVLFIFAIFYFNIRSQLRFFKCACF